MSKDYLNYTKLIDEAMQSVVRKALEHVAQYGLLGESHFFITFNTKVEGVVLDSTLKNQYPDEMTIVMQHQFSNLEVTHTQFSLGLSFNGIEHYITIPFDAITSFVDPSVKFGIQFTMDSELDDIEVLPHAQEEDNSPEAEVPAGSNIVSLDSFRKDK